MIVPQISGVSSPVAGVAGSVYPAAHAAATPQSGVVNQVIYDAQGNVLQSTSTGNGFPPNAAKLDFKTTNGTTILTVP
ncbi:MAG TPA: hypothetical protein VFR70_05225 [Flavobacterium sp.]|nr:hypothetical protein [Flavobacterium sp.]